MVTEMVTMVQTTLLWRISIPTSLYQIWIATTVITLSVAASKKLSLVKQRTNLLDIRNRTSLRKK